MKNTLLVVGCALALAPGCKKNTDRVLVTGSSTIAPVLQKAAEGIERQHGFQINVQTGGSTRGIKDAHAGRNDIGAASRDLSADEQRGLHVTEIGHDGIVVVVHRDNPTKGLTTADLRDVFTKKRTQWEDGTEIVVINKAEGRGTLKVFLKHTKLKPEEIKADSVVGDNAQGVRLVAADRGAVAYLSFGEALRAVQDGAAIKLVDLDGVPATVESLRDQTYPMRRTLRVLTKGEPAANTSKVIAYITSDDGQAIVEELGFIRR